jgi:hypothetical protein
MTEVPQLLDVAIVALAWGLAFGVVGETRELPASAFPAIVVRIYDAAGTPTEFQQPALQVAAAILDRAGVSVRWIRCDPNRRVQEAAWHVRACRAPDQIA